VHVEVDSHGFRHGGARRLVRAAAFHYFRLPSERIWRDRLEKMRQAGLNAIELSYAWNYHSEGPGKFDFSGIRDLDSLHRIIEDLGFWLIARPGPYLGEDLDLGGLPAWILRDSRIAPRCRAQHRFCWSEDFLQATREWFRQVIPRIAAQPNLIGVQVESEYSVPDSFVGISESLWDLAIRWFGSAALHTRLKPYARFGSSRRDPTKGSPDPYIRALCRQIREFGVRVPILYSDRAPAAGRLLGIDVLGLNRYPLTRLDRDWRDDPRCFESFLGDEESLHAVRPENPLWYTQLQSGRIDGWTGPGYARVREWLGSEVIDEMTRAALAVGARGWTYSHFCGGTSWGYMASPGVYTSYDCGAPIDEAGRIGGAFEGIRHLNEFLDRFEEDLVTNEKEPFGREGSWCAEHLTTRRTSQRRFIFLRHSPRDAKRVPTREADRAELMPRETQIRVYSPQGRLEGISPVPVRRAPAAARPSPPLPRLERWTFSGASPQLDPAYDDSAWSKIDPRALRDGRIDIDALGVHYGFIWYRGVFHEPLDRLFLDARHCYAVWINRQQIAAGDQLRNRLGLGPDGASIRRIPLSADAFKEGRNAIVILVESLGHNQGLADDGANPRGIVHLETGPTPIDWRFRAGLVRGERGITPVVAFQGVERTRTKEVRLPHGWEGVPLGIGLYETRFRLEGIDPAKVPLGLSFDPGRGKANLYLNGYLLGRYWPERGPQRSFPLPWGVLEPEKENHLAIALWRRSPRAALGKVRFEVL